MVPCSAPLVLQPYHKEEGETDEIVAFGDDEIDPDYLPRYQLTNFAIYNSEVCAECTYMIECASPLAVWLRISWQGAGHLSSRHSVELPPWS